MSEVENTSQIQGEYPELAVADLEDAQPSLTDVNNRTLAEQIELNKLLWPLLQTLIDPNASCNEENGKTIHYELCKVGATNHRRLFDNNGHVYRTPTIPEMKDGPGSNYCTWFCCQKKSHCKVEVYQAAQRFTQNNITHNHEPEYMIFIMAKLKEAYVEILSSNTARSFKDNYQIMSEKYKIPRNAPIRSRFNTYHHFLIRNGRKVLGDRPVSTYGVVQNEREPVLADVTAQPPMAQETQEAASNLLEILESGSTCTTNSSGDSDIEIIDQFALVSTPTNHTPPPSLGDLLSGLVSPSEKAQSNKTSPLQDDKSMEADKPFDDYVSSVANWATVIFNSDTADEDSLPDIRPVSDQLQSAVESSNTLETQYFESAPTDESSRDPLSISRGATPMVVANTDSLETGPDVSSIPWVDTEATFDSLFAKALAPTAPPDKPEMIKAEPESTIQVGETLSGKEAEHLETQLMSEERDAPEDVSTNIKAESLAGSVEANAVLMDVTPTTSLSDQLPPSEQSASATPTTPSPPKGGLTSPIHKVKSGNKFECFALPPFLQELGPNLSIKRRRLTPAGQPVFVKTILFANKVLEWCFRDTLLSGYDKSSKLRQKFQKGDLTQSPVDVGDVFPFSVDSNTPEDTPTDIPLAYPMAELVKRVTYIKRRRKVKKNSKHVNVSTILFHEKALDMCFRNTLLSRQDDAPELVDLLAVGKMSPVWPEGSLEAVSSLAVDHLFPFAFSDSMKYRDDLFFKPLQIQSLDFLMDQGLTLPPVPPHMKRSYEMSRDYLTRLIATASYYVYYSQKPSIVADASLAAIYDAIVYSFQPLIVSQANEFAKIIIDIRKFLLSEFRCKSAAIVMSLIYGPISPWIHFFSLRRLKNSMSLGKTYLLTKDILQETSFDTFLDES